MSEEERIVSEAAVFQEGRKRLTCAQAQMLCGEHNIPLSEIGDICDRLGIKIILCQLGCFE